MPIFDKKSDGLSAWVSRHVQKWGLEIKKYFQNHKKKLLLGALIAIALGPYLVSRLRAPSLRITLFASESGAPTRKFDGTLSIVCFNIAHGRGASDDNWNEGGSSKRIRVEAIAEFLQQLDADVVILNEVDFCSTWSGHQNQAAAIAYSAGYPYRVEQRNLDFRFIYGSWSFGNAILSKYPLVDAEPIDFPAEKDWEDWLVGCKRGVVCGIQLDRETLIRVAAVHLEHRNESVRVKSGAMLIDLALTAGPPLLAAGDFNSTPTGFPGSSTTPDGKNTLDELIASTRFQFRPHTEPDDSELTFSSDDPKSVIDWILIPSTGSRGESAPIFREYRVIDSDLSDHYPVYSEIEWVDGS